MRIDCYISIDCTSGKPLKKNIDRALELEETAAEVVFFVIGEFEANRLGLKGSPFVLINGIDIQPSETRGIACPPTINLDNQDPECDLDYVPHTAREMPIRAAVSNSFGFGGTNGSLVFKHFSG